MKNAVMPRPLARIGGVLVLLVYFVPLFWMVITSLKSNAQLAQTPAGILFSPTVDSYRTVIGPTLWRAMGVSFAVAASTTVVVLLLAIPAAFALSRVRGAATVVILGVLLILQMVPPAASLIPLYRLLSVIGLVSTLPGLVLADVALFLPFAILLLRPFCLTVPKEVQEAAAIDGVGAVKMITRIVLPLVRNGTSTVGSIVFILAWGEFIYAATFINKPALQPLSAVISRQVTVFGVDWPSLMALATVAALPVLLVYGLAQRQLREGLTVGVGK